MDFDALQLPLAALVNSAMYDYVPTWSRPAARAAMRSSGMAVPTPKRQGELDEAAERALIGEATARLTRSSKAVFRKAGPCLWISHSHVTPDLLAEAGYRYLLDWSMDDQPVWFRSPRRQAHPRRALSAGS